MDDLRLPCDLPGCEPGEAPRLVAVLPDGGRGTRVLRLATRAGDFVLRERLAPPRPGADPGKELAAHRAAAAAGLAPSLLDADPGGRWLLMPWAGEAWTAGSLDDTGLLERLAQQLARLHALPPPAGLRPFAPVDVLAQQDHLLRRLGAEPLADAMLAEAARLAAELAAAGPPVLNHGDLTAANLVGLQPQLVDWEYAQLAPWGYDLACLLRYYPALAPQLPRLLAIAGRDGPRAREQLALQSRLFALLDDAWARVASLDSTRSDRQNDGSATLA